MSHMTTRSNDTIHSLFSIMSGRKTIRRRGRFQYDQSQAEPAHIDKVQYSVDDWNCELPDTLIEQIRQAPDGPEAKAYLRETLSNQFPSNLKHAPAAVLGRYLGPEVRHELHEKRRQYKQQSNHPTANNNQGTIARRARNRKNSRSNVTVHANVERQPSDAEHRPSSTEHQNSNASQHSHSERRHSDASSHVRSASERESHSNSDIER